jgi:hypothetical protein
LDFPLLHVRAQTTSAGQDPTHGPKLPGQGQLAHELQAQAGGGFELAGRGQDTQRDGQIEAPAFLGQIGRRQFDGDSRSGNSNWE